LHGRASNAFCRSKIEVDSASVLVNELQELLLEISCGLPGCGNFRLAPSAPALLCYWADSKSIAKRAGNDLECSWCTPLQGRKLVAWLYARPDPLFEEEGDPMSQAQQNFRLHRLVVGVSGASGTIYAVRLLEALRPAPDVEAHLVISNAAGNFYVANLDKRGFVTVIAPDGKSRVLVPPEAGLVEPAGVVVTPDGALLVSWGGDSVARVDLATGAVLNPRWFTGLSNPRQLAWDTSYRLWLADQLNDAVRRYDMLGAPIPLTIRGAGLVKPSGLAFDGKGLLYATLTGGSLVKRIRIDGDVAVISDFAVGMRNAGGIAFIG
jgi:hypothetical protein